MIDVQIAAFDNVHINVSDKSEENERIVAVDFRAGQARVLLSMKKAIELLKKLTAEVNRQQEYMVGHAAEKLLASKNWVGAISTAISWDKTVKLYVTVRKDLNIEENGAEWYALDEELRQIGWEIKKLVDWDVHTCLTMEDPANGTIIFFERRADDGPPPKIETGQEEKVTPAAEVAWDKEHC